MARIAYLLLSHKDPERVAAQARQLTAAGDFVAIHFDARAASTDFACVRAALADNPNVVFASRRIACGWGEWSLVAATIEAARAALDAFADATHFYLISGDCMPIKSAGFVRAHLDRAGRDMIEAVDFFAGDWIKTGLREERLIYRHLVNERRHKRLFYAALEAQRRLGLKRRIPADLRIYIGSQWWCLRRRTLEMILGYCHDNPEIERFFRFTWIPDETFFQTLVHHLVPTDEIEIRTPTFLIFSDYGMPATFYNDHYDFLLGQDNFFARKISADAGELRARLGALYLSDETDFAISNEGRALYHFLTGQGRVGRRHSPRFWERGSSIGRENELLVLVSKKWHISKALAARIRDACKIPAVDHLFSEDHTPLPDLGGIEVTVENRMRHRRALLRLLFEHFDTRRLVICLDPSQLDLIRDFYDDRCAVRLLEIECSVSDDFLVAHGERVGLLGTTSSAQTRQQVIQTLAENIRAEHDELRDAGFANYWHMREGATLDRNAAALQGFLDVSRALARKLAAPGHLFGD